MAENTSLKQVGLKTTLARLKVLSILENSPVRHVSAEDLYRMAVEDQAAISLATVYRVLTQFEACGLVIRHNFEGDKAVFELNDAAHHDHMICLECGAVTEFMDEHIEARQEKVAAANGFVIKHHALTLYGVCKRCRAKPKPHARPNAGRIVGQTPAEPGLKRHEALS